MRDDAGTEKLTRITQLKNQIKQLQEELDGLLAENRPVDAQSTSTPVLPALEAPGDFPQLDQSSSGEAKIQLFLNLFKGRSDICAKRWRNKPGYSPYCYNDFRPGVCQKPRVRCIDCEVGDFAPLGPEQVREHLTGQHVLGLYPLTKADTCFLLAMDLDDANWQADAQLIRSICQEEAIPVSLERSRSGNGGHLWWFFESAVPASLARQFGMAILELAMAKSPSLTFDSFDRFFPSQDMLPKDGFGNLIALPLQKDARAQGNTVFLDEDLKIIADQWSYLSRIQKLRPDDLASFCKKQLPEASPGVSPAQDLVKRISLAETDFPGKLLIHKSCGLILSKDGLSAKAIYSLRRLAAYGNPDFFAKQAMRISTYGIPRMIAAYDETEETLQLPRGSEPKLLELLDQAGAAYTLLEERVMGRRLNISFQGELTPHQEAAFLNLTASDCGVLSAATGFGKTVIGARIIAEKQCPTLILVHTKELAGQWKARLEQFLAIDEVFAAKRKNASVIGQLGGGKQSLHGILDIALLQSLVDRDHSVKDLIHDYGLVIVDECHHISAVSFSQVMSQVDAAWVYGLTATPIRKDGHHPIIFLQCGPIRYQVSAKSQAAAQNFEHNMIPRFTSLRLPPGKPPEQWHITEIYERITKSDPRNELISQDVVQAVAEGRTPLVLTERTAHLKLLEEKLIGKGLRVITLYGTMKARERHAAIAELKSAGPSEPFVLLATGRLIGEGFDEAQLDTLFLAMPIAWKGTVAQYAGRLSRSFPGKAEVRIMDYVDVHIPVLERMYQKRLKAYQSVGYQIGRTSTQTPESLRIFDGANYLPTLLEDLHRAKAQIILSSPYPKRQKMQTLLPQLQEIFQSGKRITLCTKPLDEVKDAYRKNTRQLHSELSERGLHIQPVPGLHLHFILVDETILWYGSLDPLGTQQADDSLIRMEDPLLAAEFLAMISLDP